MTKYLFRGMREDNKQWVYGLPYSLHASNKPEGIETWDGERHPIDPETIGLCSGIPDKNGKSIYEGDIVLARGVKGTYWRPVIGIVIFECGTFKLKVVANETQDESYRMIADIRVSAIKDPKAFSIENNFIFRNYELEVIGTVYGDSEILLGDILHE